MINTFIHEFFQPERQKALESVDGLARQYWFRVFNNQFLATVQRAKKEYIKSGMLPGQKGGVYTRPVYAVPSAFSYLLYQEEPVDENRIHWERALDILETPEAREVYGLDYSSLSNMTLPEVEEMEHRIALLRERLEKAKADAAKNKPK